MDRRPLLAFLLLTAGTGLVKSQIDSRQVFVQEIASATGDAPAIRWDAARQTPRFIEGRLSLPSAQPPARIARDFLAQHGALFNVADPGAEFRLARQSPDRLGKTHVRFQQCCQGIDLWGDELIVHLNADGSIYCIGGRTHPTPSISVQPAIDSLGALARARSLFPSGYAVASLARSIYARGPAPRLAWKAELVQGPEQDWLVFLDAQSGELLLSFNQTPYDGPVTGSGTGLDQQTKPLQLYQQAAAYEMVDVTRSMFVSGDAVGSENAGNIVTKDARTGSVVTGNSTVMTDSAAVDAHYYAGAFFDYLRTTFGRNSWDDLGGSIVSNVHVGTGYDNAFWSPTYLQMFYGDGDGKNFRPFPGARDLVAHEITHGITQSTSGLIYLDESGALNESFSDIIATAFDTRNWTIGEDNTLAQPGFDRNMADPHQGYPFFPLPIGAQAASMAEYLYAPIDDGGVHLNSGIHNKVMYNLSQSIGRANAAQVFYRAFTEYLTSDAQFVDARNAAVRAARDLNLDTAAVGVAYSQVGILPVTQDASEMLKYDPYAESTIAELAMLPLITTASPDDRFSVRMSPSALPSQLMTVAFIYGAGQQGREVVVSIREDSAGIPGKELDSLHCTLSTDYAFAALVDFSQRGIAVKGDFHVVLTSPASGFSLAYLSPFTTTHSLEYNGTAWTHLNGALAMRASVRCQQNTTSGSRWAKQTTGTGQALRSLAMLTRDEGWAVGSWGTILHTTTGGLLWNAVPVNSGATFNAVSFTDKQHGYAVGDVTDILCTTDGGSSWQWASNPSGSNLKAVAFSGPQTGWAVGNFGAVIRTTDGGLTWQQQTASTMSNFYAVHFVDALNGWVAGANSAVYHTTDGGATWQSQSVPVSTTFYAVKFADVRRGWLAGANGIVLKTTDGGSSWVQQLSPTTNALRGLWVADSATVYAVGFYGTLIRTGDGNSWTAEASGVYDNLWGVQFIDPDNGWIAGESGTILSARTQLTAVRPPQDLPGEWSLSQNYPNPFNPATTIGYTLPRKARVSLLVYNMLGQRVAVLVSSDQEAGRYAVKFDGSGLASGVYFYRLEAAPLDAASLGRTAPARAYVQTQKLLLLR